MASSVTAGTASGGGSGKGPILASAQMANSKAVATVHTVMACFVGATAGILGFTGLRGFLFYFVCHVAVAAVFMVLKMGGTPGHYLQTSPVGFLVGGAMSHLLTFLMFWTLAYALVHVY